nr:MAG TPA: hypothetical protein [Caudoviricetes sp.]
MVERYLIGKDFFDNYLRLYQTFLIFSVITEKKSLFKSDFKK